MNPVRFPDHDCILGAPKGWDEAKDGPCIGLPVLRHGDMCVSVWRPTFRERVKILFGFDIQLAVFSGRTQPPVWLTISKNKGDIVEMPE